ncbi:Histone H2A.Z-specific chaperone CHZ1 [Fusarium falciforme]|uniref:Histone H2A.Z-specific chaperone CHZ1 n=2 Tax=Fusarium solani species complex TaxID=232080 RepID=A0A9W8V0S9_9HYPO|nr:CHZ domain-containing protein [Fusarium keratoplasticum]XP_053002025.1 CHZ domain-containing protein [Fusarium falciforme]KAI8683731.1 CHZ domain-containing protein [Fusarium keratoplasticum]KAI8687847.1 CHZ domain-containing protein [Fusarium keratoplasticum]KAJ4173275.1 Histone H2A.Z-specific chaperone CHZ1 [Fusarium falciforme]KAJ4186039.1 Histone H2A.Z-specific chaperone CHZ1 [Fusarium falciforme]WAO83215.1 CHZ domain-containing protein [Fusarium falciforme]
MAENSATIPQDPTKIQEDTVAESKGKGAAAPEDIHEDTAMDEDDDDDDSDDDEEVVEADEDGMEEIDLNNIVEGGRRTRGAVIDFAKAAEQHPAEDEDEEDDDDFQPTEDVKMSD